MKIRNIEKLNYARFRNFQWDKSLGDFSKGVNILFGWNGSGKTTFSEVFRSIEKNNVSEECTFKIGHDSGHVTEANSLANLENKIRVFNDSYIEESLAGSSEFPHIFFAGEEAVDYEQEEKLLEDKNSNLSKVTLPSKHDEIARNTAVLIKGVTGINSYRKELTGGGTYSSYDKTDFEKRLGHIQGKIENKEIKTPKDLIRGDIDTLKTRLVDSERLANIDKDISAAAKWLLNNIEEINNLFRSEPVQVLSQRVGSLNDKETEWVREGVELHFSGEDVYATCLFCNSKIANKNELIDHFSNEVIRTVNNIDSYLKDIESFTRGFAKTESPTKSQKEGIYFLRSTFDTLTSDLREKRNSISNTKEPVGVDIKRLQELTIVTSTNSVTIAYTIETHYVAEKYQEYEASKLEYEKAVKSKKRLEDEVKELTQKVRILKQKAKNTHEPADALNRLFKVVFPYRKIEIVDNSNGTSYTLKRDDGPCNFSTLSEGEKNFIALAYFVSSINDAQSSLSDDGVVIIDDPVSSLDKQAIFQIFSVIVNEIKKHPARQYFLLTHNLDFLGHLKENFKNKIKKDDVRLFGFETTESGCLITAMPDLLKKHRSDYYYIFSVLYKFKENCSMEEAHLVVNLLRRWLETFLNFKFSSHGNLRSTLEAAYLEAEEISSKSKTTFSADYLEMYRFVNHGSHGFSDAESTDESILINAGSRIQEAFMLVKILDPLHYKKLMTLI